MRHNLGKIIALLFITLDLLASDLCDVNVLVSKRDPFLNEEILLKVEATQKKSDNAMFFEFLYPKSPNYKIVLINQSKQKSSTKHQKVIFNYRLKPLKAGEITIPLSIKVKEVSFASVNSFNTGSADELEDLQTKDTILKIEPLTLDVKNLQKKVDFIGDFTIEESISKTEVDSFEPTYINYKIRGRGSHNQIADLLPDIKGVDKFLEKSGDLEFDYALSSNRDFTIPSISLSCYSPEKKIYYTLKTKDHRIKVKQIDSRTLLDSENSYPTTSFEFKKIVPYLSALLIYLAGYFSAKFKLFDFLRFRDIKKEDEFIKKIKATKTEKELLQLLLTKNKKSYEPFTRELEESIYQNKRVDLAKIKDKLSKL